MNDEGAFSSSMSQENESENLRSVSQKTPSPVGIYEFTQEQQDRVLEILSRNVSCPCIYFYTEPTNWVSNFTTWRESLLRTSGINEQS